MYVYSIIICCDIHGVNYASFSNMSFILPYSLPSSSDKHCIQLNALQW